MLDGAFLLIVFAFEKFFLSQNFHRCRAIAILQMTTNISEQSETEDYI
jgi:hypothetical protein